MNTKVYCDSGLDNYCIVHDDVALLCKHNTKVTVNEGEYIAILEALQLGWLMPITILSDSQLVVNQVLGTYKCNYPRLREYRDEVRKLLERSKSTIQWIPREENKAGIILEGRKNK
jgi:ribonuclease HI